MTGTAAIDARLIQRRTTMMIRPTARHERRNPGEAVAAATRRSVVVRTRGPLLFLAVIVVVAALHAPCAGAFLLVRPPATSSPAGTTTFGEATPPPPSPETPRNTIAAITASSSLSSSTALRMSSPLDNLDRGFNLLETAGKLVPQGRLVKTAKEGWRFAWTRMMAELAPQDKTGAYRRPSYAFDGRIGDGNFPDEAGRYHLYVGNPCPWCHRAVLAASLRSATSSEIGITRLIDDPTRASRGGWVFDRSSPKNRDPIFGCSDLRELYDRLVPGGEYRGRCTAPLLVDKKTRKIVSNESSDIVRMISGATFGDADKDRMELYPPELAAKIDETNEWVYRLVNNGVYRCGFATTQKAYDEASADVREGLRRIEQILHFSEYVCGDAFTEADLRLLPTALRFDGAYGPLFRAGGSHVRLRSDYPNLHRWMRRCWQDVPGVRGTIDLADACSSYYRQLFPLNPGGIVPTPVSEEDLGLIG